MKTQDELLVLCENFKLLRKTNGLSQKKMAKICGIGIGSLRKIENGFIPPKFTIEPIFKASYYFKIPASKFFSPILNIAPIKRKDFLYNK